MGLAVTSGRSIFPITLSRFGLIREAVSIYFRESNSRLLNSVKRASFQLALERVNDVSRLVSSPSMWNCRACRWGVGNFSRFVSGWGVPLCGQAVLSICYGSLLVLRRGPIIFKKSVFSMPRSFPDGVFWYVQVNGPIFGSMANRLSAYRLNMSCSYFNFPIFPSFGVQYCCASELFCLFPIR